MKMKAPRHKPRLPDEARARLHTGSAHKDRTRYDRKRDRKSLQEQIFVPAIF